MDYISPEHRSWNMAQIKNKNTGIEVKVRQYLFAQGFRFRKNDKRYAGHPDVVLPKYHTVIFVNGCFWHHHPGCRYATIPKSNTDYWNAKFARNARNDQKHQAELEAEGWQVITIWECELKSKNFEQTMAKVTRQVRQNLPETESRRISEKIGSKQNHTAE